MSVEETIGEFTLRADSGAAVAAAAGRVEYANSLIDERRAALDAAAGDDSIARAMSRFAGPAFRVNVPAAELPALLDEQEIRAGLEHIARHGDRCGVVILVHGGDVETVTGALASSRALTAALMAGKSVRLVDSPGLPAGTTARRAESILIDDHFLSAVADDPGALARVVVGVGGTAARRIAAAFRLAADVLDPDGAA